MASAPDEYSSQGTSRAVRDYRIGDSITGMEPPSGKSVDGRVKLGIFQRSPGLLLVYEQKRISNLPSWANFIAPHMSFLASSAAVSTSGVMASFSYLLLSFVYLDHPVRRRSYSFCDFRLGEGSSYIEHNDTRYGIDAEIKVDQVR